MVTGANGSPLRVIEETPIPVEGVLESKLHPPTLRSEWIERSRLMDKIAEAVRLPVLVVAAPAGYGKSTMITQWVNTPAAGTAAWVYLDPADNDPTRLWAHVTAALERVGCRVDADVAWVHRHQCDGHPDQGAAAESSRPWPRIRRP